jgi:hypothetical protein
VVVILNFHPVEFNDGCENVPGIFQLAIDADARIYSPLLLSV